jgi:hypothetical protein
VVDSRSDFASFTATNVEMTSAFEGMATPTMICSHDGTALSPAVACTNELSRGRPSPSMKLLKSVQEQVEGELELELDIVEQLPCESLHSADDAVHHVVGQLGCEPTGQEDSSE